MNKKIYFIRLGSTKFGGAENYLTRLSKALSKKNVEHQIINSFFPKFLPSWLGALLFNVQVSYNKKGKFYYSLDRITCPDVYRAGDGVHKVFLSIEKKSSLNLLHPVYLYLERNCFKNSKLIIANSQMVKNQIIETYGISAEKIKVIYNGIEIKQYSFSKSFEKLSQEFLLKDNESILLFVGSGYKRKGVKEFLEIFSKLKSKNIKAFVIGKENNIEYYKNLSKKLNIDGNVVFTGPRIDVDDFYTISDIFLFPTHYDPFSNVILEAMSFGNVVFTTRSNGASEIINENFIMDNPIDNKVISNIDNILKNKSVLDAEKNNNIELSKLFSIENNLDKTLKEIRKIE